VDAEMEAKWMEEFEEGRRGEQVFVAKLGIRNRETSESGIHMGQGAFGLNSQ
jgi:hypothetical protein